MPKVTVVTDDVDQINFLEQELSRANLEYEVESGITHPWLPKPYLRVDGVPLDLFRALKWIKEYSNER